MDWQGYRGAGGDYSWAGGYYRQAVEVEGRAGEEGQVSEGLTLEQCKKRAADAMDYCMGGTQCDITGFPEETWGELAESLRSYASQFAIAANVVASYASIASRKAKTGGDGHD